MAFVDYRVRTLCLTQYYFRHEFLLVIVALTVRLEGERPAAEQVQLAHLRRENHRNGRAELAKNSVIDSPIGATILQYLIAGRENGHAGAALEQREPARDDHRPARNDEGCNWAKFITLPQKNSTGIVISKRRPTVSDAHHEAQDGGEGGVGRVQYDERRHHAAHCREYGTERHHGLGAESAM